MQRAVSKGFTLVELLISISIFSIMMAYITYVLFGAISVSGRASDRSKSMAMTVFVLDYISSDIFNAKTISDTSDDDRLVLNLDGKSVVYGYRDGKIRRQEGEAAAYLTDVNEIKGIKFAYPDGGVKVDVSTSTGIYDILAYPRSGQ